MFPIHPMHTMSMLLVSIFTSHAAVLDASDVSSPFVALLSPSSSPFSYDDPSQRPEARGYCVVMHQYPPHIVVVGMSMIPRMMRRTLVALEMEPEIPVGFAAAYPPDSRLWLDSHPITDNLTWCLGQEETGRLIRNDPFPFLNVETAGGASLSIDTIPVLLVPSQEVQHEHQVG